MLALMFAALSAAAASFPGANLEWTFDRAGDLQGWQPNGHLADTRVADGALFCRGTGSDPILELRTPLEFSTSPWQQLEVTLKADREGAAEFFWSNTSTGRFGGFTQAKTTRFRVAGDGQWHTYRLLPFWHPEKKIVRLRFDLYDGAQFAIDRLAITELKAPEPAATPAWDFSRSGLGWQEWAAATEPHHLPGGLVSSNSAPDAFLLGPPIRVDAAERNYFSLRMAVDRGKHGTLFFATDSAYGLHACSFPLEADGRLHTYNIDLLASAGWRGRVIALALRPSDDPQAIAHIRSLELADLPKGPPQLKLVSFALEDALPCAGVPATLSAIVANTGGEPASNVQTRLALPAQFAVTPQPASGARARLEFAEESLFQWKLASAQPGTGMVSLTVTAANAEPLTASSEVHFTSRLDVGRTGYVPEPTPIRGPCEVGVYYFPGWNTPSRWEPLARFPERKPVLGFYREGDPEVADWHIKWAVEHGITFFAYDWYWNRGARQLEHALHNGFFNARYRHLLKFCLLWANHNPPNTSSIEDCRAVTAYWIQNYFRRPEYLTVAGCPVIIIFSTDRLTSDLGSPGVRQAFESMRRQCRDAGLPGLHLVACIADTGGARRAGEEGYDAASAYNWPGLGMSGEGNYGSFSNLIQGFRLHWKHLLADSPLPLSPLPVCGGWDSRPWHGENNLVRFGRTPALFMQHLLDARETLARSKSPRPPMILIEAWNEWGEGSYIEPHKEFGFGYLDAIRQVFTDSPSAHVDLSPADAGLGPYDLPPAAPAATAWNFSAGPQGWDNTMDMANFSSREGSVAARSIGADPAFFGPVMQARASAYAAVVLRLKLSAAPAAAFRDTAQLFWRTSRLPESEASSERFEVIADGQWHQYRIRVADHPRWRGIITRLRLDPCNRRDVEIALSSLLLE